MTESSKTMKTTTTTTMKTTMTKKIGNYDPVDLVLSSTCSCSDETTCLHCDCSMGPWAMETYSHSYYDPDCETSSPSSSRRLLEHP